MLTGVLPAVNASLLVAYSALSDRPKGQAGGDGSSKQLHSLEQLSSHRLGLGTFASETFVVGSAQVSMPCVYARAADHLTRIVLNVFGWEITGCT